MIGNQKQMPVSVFSGFTYIEQKNNIWHHIFKVKTLAYCHKLIQIHTSFWIKELLHQIKFNALFVGNITFFGEGLQSWSAVFYDKVKLKK